MSRNLATANLAEVNADALTPLLFLELRFDEGTSYIHNGIAPFQWADPVEHLDSPIPTWLGVGALGKIEPVEEGMTLTPFGLSASLSGVDPTFISRAQNSEVYGRKMLLWIGFLDDGDLVANPDMLWSGQMDTMEITLGETNVVTVRAESDLKFFAQKNGKMFNNAHQQVDHPADRLFQYQEQMVDARVIWHGPRQVFSGGSGSGGGGGGRSNDFRSGREAGDFED